MGKFRDLAPYLAAIKKFEICPIENLAGGCWTIKCASDADGYKIITANGKRFRAHRLSWAYFNYALDPKLILCHTCDNPPCINPGHLFPGTNADNIRDCISKGRHFGRHKNILCGRGHPQNALHRYHNGRRGCKTCNDTQARERARKVRSSKPENFKLP